MLTLQKDDIDFDDGNYENDIDGEVDDDDDDDVPEDR